MLKQAVDLAGSLNNVANSLSDLGRREEALAAAEEAVRLYQQLAQQRPDAFLPDLATSLNNVANRLSELGRREEALATAEEALLLYRQLAQQPPLEGFRDQYRYLAEHRDRLREAMNLARFKRLQSAASKADFLARALTQPDHGPSYSGQKLAYVKLRAKS